MTFDKKERRKDRPLFQKHNHDHGPPSLPAPAWLSNYSTEGRSPQHCKCFPRMALALLTQTAKQAIRRRKKSWAADFNYRLFRLNAVLKVQCRGCATIQVMAAQFQVRQDLSESVGERPTFQGEEGLGSAKEPFLVGVGNKR